MTEIDFGKVGSVGGRYYGMDRDKNWDRVQIHYDVLTQSKGPHFDSAVEGVEASYSNNVFDEFVMPFNVEARGIVENKDSVIFANFRPDRAMDLQTLLLFLQ